MAKVLTWPVFNLYDREEKNYFKTLLNKGGCVKNVHHTHSPISSEKFWIRHCSLIFKATALHGH